MREVLALSAENVGTTTNEASREETFTTQRPNPVALEVPVTVTGARASDKAEGRNLFSEETKTVLVFRDGAVIHLAAGVAAGQLLFLTNKNNNREEVCQVIRKRIYKPTSCFVELEFTEAAEDFWGVEFAKVQVEASLPKAADVEGAEVTEEASSTGEEQGPEEVERLREEVKKLREQLNALVKGSPSAEAVTADRSVKTQIKHAEGIPLEPRAPKQAVEKMELAHVNDQNPVAEVVSEKVVAAAQVPAMTGEASREKVQSGQDASFAAETPAGGMTEKKDERRPVVRMALPNRRVESATPTDPSEDLLPKPGLDFSKIPAWAPHPGESDPNSIYKPVRGKAEQIRLAVVGILFAAIVAGGGWYGARRILPRGKKAEVTAPDSGATAKAGKTGMPAVGASGPSEVAPANTNDAVAEATKAIQDRLEAREKQKVAAAKAIPEANAEMAPTNGGAVPGVSSETIQGSPIGDQGKPIEPRGKQKAAATKSNAGTNAVLKKSLPNAGRKSVELAPKESVTPVRAESVPNNTPIVGPKLIKAVAPVYPPDAMRNYITGDVRAEVMVEADGSVSAVKVLSGPGVFHVPAVEALKQYHYQAATQGGKAVASKMMETVKFWFNP